LRAVALALPVEEPVHVRARVAAGLEIHDPPPALCVAQDAVDDQSARGGVQAILASCFGVRAKQPAPRSSAMVFVNAATTRSVAKMISDA
jgi:hypothetical protein